MLAAPLPRSFYERPAPVVAPELLGCLLVRTGQSEPLAGRIVEVEAYLGAEDAASHAFRGPTPRSRIMFGAAGMAYVYFIYGAHYCLNVVTGLQGEGAAILIRAVEPLLGLDYMAARRQTRPRSLTNGPGKLCQAFGIGREQNGHDLTLGEELWIADKGPDSAAVSICAGPRIGVRGDELARTVAWRFFYADSPFVSPSPLNRNCRHFQPGLTMPPAA